jgi:hypothetical protein
MRNGGDGAVPSPPQSALICVNLRFLPFPHSPFTAASLPVFADS